MGALAYAAVTFVLLPVGILAWVILWGMVRDLIKYGRD